MIAEGTSGELKASVGSGALHVRVLDAERRGDAEKVLAGVLGPPVTREADPAALSVRVSDGERAAVALSELSRAGLPIANFSLGQPSLDEVFLALTGHVAADPTTGDQ